MGWNYRVLATKDGEDVHFQVHSVYYEGDNDSKPVGASADGARIGGNTIAEINLEIERFQLATKKTILWGDDRFPQEYKP